MPAREHWKSRFGFIMATAGFAVGLGNIWRFPYVVGENGGGAFLVLYLAFAILIGIPLLTAEISMGRKSQLSPIEGMRRLTGGRGSPWNLIGWLGIITGYLILSVYVMLLAWVAGYFVMLVTGELPTDSPERIRETFEGFVSRPGRVLFFDFLLLAVAGFLVSRGLTKGVERIAKVAMPVLFGMLLVLVVRALTLPGAGEGISWYLKPDFSKIDGSVVLVALGQAFYSIGIGFGGAFGLGSYLDREKSDVPGDAAMVVGFDTLVAIVAGFAIFPALFAFGLSPDSGPDLLFVTMPSLFGQMPAGMLFGATFLFLMLIAGLTSVLAFLEVASATLVDSLGIPRKPAALIVVTVWFVLSIPVVLSLGPWSEFKILDRDLFRLVDYVCGTYLIAGCALLISLYVAIRWGWERFRDETNVGSGPVKVLPSWRPFVQFLIPVAVVTILLAGLVIL